MYKLTYLLLFITAFFIDPKNEIENEVLKIPINDIEVTLEYTSGSFPLKLITIENDTILVEGGSIDDILSISTSSKNTEHRFKIDQRYKSQLAIEFDGKSFVLENWKTHFSPWIKLWQESNGTNVKKYSYFDAAYFPEITQKEILDGIITNKNNIGEHWSKYLLTEFKKTNRNKNQEPYHSPTITETHFKLTDEKGDSILLILKHLIGC